jgi:putative ABC transport system permease protein
MIKRFELKIAKIRDDREESASSNLRLQFDGRSVEHFPPERKQGMNGFFQDVCYSLRQLRKSRGFSLVAIVTLALGIGATTAIFSVVYGVLLRPLPYSNPDRIMAIFEVNSRGAWSRLADPNFDDFRDQSRSFDAIAKYSAYVGSVSGGSEPTRSMVASVSPQFFKVFRAQPLFGREFMAVDAKQGAAPVVVVSYGYWKQYLGSSADLSRLHLKIDNAVFSVISVMPPSFQFPSDAELWVAADREGENLSRSSHNYSGVARLRDGVTVEQANAEINGIAHRIYESAPEKTDYLNRDATVLPLQESMTREVRPALLVLLGAVGFLLLVACANIANLLLAQASVRERELAIRTALGAARWRLFRQFVTETSLLAALGGGLGVLAALFGVPGLLALAPKNLPGLDSVSVNIPVLVFACLLSSAVAVSLGAFTAWRGTAGNLREGLEEGGRSHAGSHTSQSVGRAIVAAQIAVTLALVIGAGLLGRSLMKVLEVDPGFRVDKIVTMDVSLPGADWSDAKAKIAQGIFVANLIDRLEQIPGVREAGATSGLPLNGGLPDGMFLLVTQDEIPKNTNDLDALGRWFDNTSRQKKRTGEADFGVATDGYFQTLGIPLVRGRLFDQRDGPDSPHVAVISESLARQRWPGQNPIGQTIEFGNMDGDVRLLTIVGIVGDVHEYGLDAPPRPTVYVDLFQRPRPDVTLTMLTGADTEMVTSSAREILRQLNPEVAPRFETFSQIYSASLGSRRFDVILVGFFGIMALLLAGIGVFGVMAYSVSRRTREIGVRVAMGARSRDVLAMILGQGLRTILIGVAIGLAGSVLLTRALQSMLFGITATDPLTFAAVILILVMTALLACYLPARRAAKVDPMVALRYE